MKRYADIDAYISAAPETVQPQLRQLRETIRRAAPDAAEGISYGMPVYKQNGNLVYFGAFKHHLSFFPTASGVAQFKKELAGYKIAKGTIQLPFDQPLPLALIAKIVAFRVAENGKKRP